MPEDHIQEEPELPRPDRTRKPTPESEQQEDRPRRSRRKDEEDDDDRSLRRIRRREDDGGLNTLIPYKNPKALIAYYLGVFALIPCIGVLLGTASLILGILGLKYRKLHPSAGGTGHAWAGIILGSLVLLGHVAVAILIAITASSR